ncbi:unnamed protein product [Diplocarpon coronariae]|nr:hypothetical protein JHW43_003110 [Diplocarpon mali]
MAIIVPAPVSEDLDDGRAIAGEIPRGRPARAEEQSTRRSEAKRGCCGAGHTGPPESGMAAAVSRAGRLSSALLWGPSGDLWAAVATTGDGTLESGEVRFVSHTGTAPCRARTSLVRVYHGRGKWPARQFCTVLCCRWPLTTWSRDRLQRGERRGQNKPCRRISVAHVQAVPAGRRRAWYKYIRRASHPALVVVGPDSPAHKSPTSARAGDAGRRRGILCGVLGTWEVRGGQRRLAKLPVPCLFPLFPEPLSPGPLSPDPLSPDPLSPSGSGSKPPGDHDWLHAASMEREMTISATVQRHTTRAPLELDQILETRCGGLMTACQPHLAAAPPLTLAR